MSDSQNWSSYDDETHQSTTVIKTDNDIHPSKDDNLPIIKSFDWNNFRNRLVFGGLVGFCSGVTFGAIDSARSYQKQHGALQRTAIHYIANGSVLTGSAFSGFFLTYQGAKTYLQYQYPKNDIYLNMSIATVASSIPFIRSTIMRQNLIYAGMLIALDHFQDMK